jgi:transposase-like protein
MSIISNDYFYDEAAAFAKLESVLWPDGPVCPHCGSTKKVYDLKTRIGLKKCGACRKQFTVRVGTIFENSHVPLHKWLQATYLFCCTQRRISARQLHRILEVSYKTAWLMTHRLREAMRSGTLAPIGGDQGKVKPDKTSIHRKAGKKPKRQKNGRHYSHEAVTETGYNGAMSSNLVDRGGIVRFVPGAKKRCRAAPIGTPSSSTAVNPMQPAP